METNIKGALEIFRTMKIKPNFSELQRMYDIDRHTIKKYYDQKDKKKYALRTCILDAFQKDIKQIMDKPGVTKKAAYEYLKAKYPTAKIGSYSGFRHYTIKTNIEINKSTKPHVRFESKPGHQLQVDWRENMKLSTITGEVLQFHCLSSTLGFSRFHLFIYSKTKTTEDFIRCMIETFQRLGGVPDVALTDNMSAVVIIKNGIKYKHSKIKAFEKDCGVTIQLCKARSPQTKGKDESANRFLNWLKAYDGEIRDETHLISLLEDLNRKVNLEVNQTTCIPPHLLFQKEKEYLHPLPNHLMLDRYVDCVSTQVVPPTLLVVHKGSGYSVPAKFIHKRVKLVPIENKLYIYCNTELITIHECTNRKFNYHHQDYRDGLRKSITSPNLDIDAIAHENMAMFKNIGDCEK